MWAPRLPFGYVESPRLFCSLMEAIADVLRIEEASIRVVDRSETHVHLEYRSGGGQLIHFFVFVDDWLVVARRRHAGAGSSAGAPVRAPRHQA
jgi:hypothetical protein